MLWSWRESNPRPNTLQKCFLHAYPLFDFRLIYGKRQTSQQLILLNSSLYQGSTKTISTFPMLLTDRRRDWLSGKQLVLKMVKQPEQICYFRHLFWHES